MMGEFYTDPRLPPMKSLEGIKTFEEAEKHLRTTVVFAESNCFEGVKQVDRVTEAKPKYVTVPKVFDDKPIVDQFPDLVFFSPYAWALYAKEASSVNLLGDFCQQINEEVSFYRFPVPKHLPFADLKNASGINAVDRVYFDRLAEFLLSVEFVTKPDLSNKYVSTQLGLGMQRLLMDDPWSFGSVRQDELKKVPVFGLYPIYRQLFRVVYRQVSTSEGVYQPWVLDPLPEASVHPNNVTFNYQTYSVEWSLT